MNLLKKKSIWIGVLLLLVLGGITIYVIHKEIDSQKIWETIKNADIVWVIVAILAMCIYALADAVNINRCLRLVGYKASFLQLLKYSYAGFFFSSITPSSTGGQPAQLYFMAKDKIKISHSSFTLLTALLSYQCAVVVLGVIGVLFSGGEIFNLEGSFSYVFPIGFALNIAIILLLMGVLFSRKVAHIMAGICVWFVKILRMDKSVKYEIFRSFIAYSKAATLMKNNKTVFLKMLFTSFIQLALFHSVTFFSARAIGITDLSWFSVLFIQSSLFISVSSLPLPGATGVTEYGYALFYANQIPSDLLPGVMILSRFISFVLQLILSGVGLTILYIVTKKRSVEFEDASHNKIL